MDYNKARMPESGVEPQVRKFWQLFEKQEFFESHEVLEELWMVATGSERNLYKGLIQIAVSLHHLGDGNLRGARKVFDTARDLLEPYQPSGAGVRLDRLVNDARSLVEEHERAAARGLEAGPIQVAPVYEPGSL